MIFPEDGGPIFRQVAAILREDITSGRIRPGQRLPSETTIQQTYDVARLTARAAVNVLRAEGLAELRRGLGVVVRQPPELRDLEVPVGASVVARMPTAEERDEYDISAGVPVFSVTDARGAVEVYAADRWRLRRPS